MKFGKQAAVLGLTTAMLLSAVPPVLADKAAPASDSVSSAPAASNPGTPAAEAPSDVKISKERAIELAPTFVTIPSDYKLQGISYNSRQYPNGSGAWSINYEKRQQDRYFGNISITIDAETGSLLSYYSYENDPSSPEAFPPKLDWSAAKASAEQVLGRLAPDLKGQVVYSDDYEKTSKPPLNGQIRYTVKYDREVNDVRYAQNFIQITLDGNGKLVGFERRWDTALLSFDDLSGLLTQEQAEAAMKQKLSSELSYLYLNPMGGGSAKPMLGYLLKTPMLDAKTGKLINEAGKEVTSPTTYETLTDKPLAAMPAGGRNLTKEQAVAAAAAIIQLPKGAELTDASYYEDHSDMGISSWNLSWKLPGSTERDSDYYRASIHSQTGELLNFSHDGTMMLAKLAMASGEAGKSPASIDPKDATAKAVDYVKTILPHYSDQLAIDPEWLASQASADPGGMLSIPFKRLVNGIPSDSESIQVTVAASGEIAGYWGNLRRIDVPKPGKTIDAKQATELLLAQYTLELRYYVPVDYRFYYEDNSKKARQAKPYYVLVPKQPDQFVFVDAATGEFRKRDTGAITVPGRPAATDLAGHWAQQELQLMIDYGAIDVKDGKVSPDQAITRGEMIKMLVIARNGGDYMPFLGDRMASFKDVAASSPYFSYVEQAVDANLIDKSENTFRPEDHMTRDDLAVLLVRALGYNKLAEHDSLFNLKAADAAAIKNKGQAAILLELGIMTTSDGRFQPAQEVSRAQAATTFYRYLEQRAMLRDVPIGM
ncbi:hypothetical protein J31TS4_21090 [Paenibacillus sp. J31TS4]|uniref:YcdB/YcdC domain-containing protein n=1 Tax=Paenibacillus sp. J31TS4 TaxID=2807195 RepID=UPI001AFDCEA7|nr:S-layer homology domain-containing protein [Paenibacillus sp. J31TS4]GIP38829.1 hypothetical protein J31TS4_21090 [Paenibacillus sp. J31TS4]